jgi:uncharacterized membrane protein YcaP (DUF421 family)
MGWLFDIEFRELFVPTHSIAEAIVRGSLMYLALFLTLRFFMKRRTGSLSIADLLVIVVIADAAQNAFAKDYRSITEGIVLVLTIVFWDRTLDWLSFNYPSIRRFLHSPPLLVMRKGRMIRKHMEQESLADDELMRHLREAGIEDLSEIERAYLEDDGRISIIRRKKPEGDPKANDPSDDTRRR